jgi:UDP-glucose 4-epimerase
VGHYGMVIPRFVNQALDGGPITVYGDGKQTRSFASVSDVVKVLSILMENEEAVGEVFNVGSDEEISIDTLAGLVRDMVDPAVEITHVPYEEAYEEGFEDLRRRVPDVTKLRDLTGLAPTTGIEQILERVIEYEKNKRTSK